ncbi:MAG: hypothetical protein ACTTGZ_02350 [Treponema sp.]
MRNNFTTKQIQFTQCAKGVQTLSRIQSETGITAKAEYMARQEQGCEHKGKNGNNLIIPNTRARVSSNAKPVRCSYYYGNVKSRIVHGSTKFSSHKAAHVARAFVAAQTQDFIH